MFIFCHFSTDWKVECRAWDWGFLRVSMGERKLGTLFCTAPKESLTQSPRTFSSDNAKQCILVEGSHRVSCSHKTVYLWLLFTDLRALLKYKQACDPSCCQVFFSIDPDVCFRTVTGWRASSFLNSAVLRFLPFSSGNGGKLCLCRC